MCMPSRIIRSDSTKGDKVIPRPLPCLNQVFEDASALQPMLPSIMNVFSPSQYRIRERERIIRLPYTQLPYIKVIS